MDSVFREHYIINAMNPSFYQIRVCQTPSCGLRYPITENHPFGERCPLCLGGTRAVLQKNLPQQENQPPNPAPARKIHALLDNIRSAWNVGAIFRTADGLGVEALHLCGITPTPENESVRKTALGAEKFVAWDYARNALTCAAELKAQGCQLFALEQDERATLDWASVISAVSAPLILIVGNEVTGVDPALLDLCDAILELPMRGRKRSLNVEVAFGIGLSKLV